jgi:Predicted signal-transduction protein containing cAMP-binding and CBS domains
MGITSITVKDVMRTDVKYITKDATLYDAIKAMSSSWVSSLIVVNSNKEPLGIVTEKDAVRALAWSVNGLDLKVTNAMSTPIVTVEDTAYLDTALTVMVERGINHLPVTNGGKIVGILTSRDIVRFIVKNRLLAPEVIEGLNIKRRSEDDVSRLKSMLSHGLGPYINRPLSIT